MPFFRPMREFFVALWRRTERQFPQAPRPFVQLLRVLLVISVVGWATSYVLEVTGASQSDEAWSTGQVLNAAKSRLSAYTAVLDSIRDRLASDIQIRGNAQQRNMSELFTMLRQKDSQYAATFPDSALTVQTTNGRRLAEHGSAVYTADGRLLAWYTSPSVSFGFDTSLTGEMLLANRDKGVFLENAPLYTYLTSIRKLVAKDSMGSRILEGYVETKRLLATKELLGQPSRGYFIASLSEPAQRNVSINFGGVPGRLASDRNWVRTDLFAEPNDPGSYVGSLAIATKAKSEPSTLYRISDDVWRLSATLLLFAMLVWLFFAIAEPVDSDRPLLTRLWFSLLVIGAAAIVRLAVAWIGGLSLLIGDAYQNASDYSSTWGFGIAEDPFHLFVTSVFATACAVMLWIVWMPRQRLVRDDSKKKDIEQIVRREAWMLILFMLAVVFGLQLLADGMSATVEAIITNGTLRYTAVRQILPPPGLLMMLVAFLGFGVAYLFVVSLLLTFALRAAIFLISRRLSLLTRILGGSLILAALMVIAVWISDDWHLSDVTLLYRSSIAALAFAVSLSVIAIDALSPDPIEGGPSFLYKLPRSSRSILFILTISALIMSPLVASKQVSADKEAAVRLVRQSALVGANELSHSVTQMLNGARDRLQDWSREGRDTTALREFAFLTWVDEAREHPTWEASITLDRDQQATALSHFATPGSALELRKIAAAIDSVQRLVKDSTRQMLITVVPSATSASTPAAVGVTRLIDTIRVANVARSTSLRATVALWTDLPIPLHPTMKAAVGGAGAAALGGGSSASDDRFIISEYRGNTRRTTNAPWLDVPASLPRWTLRLKPDQSAWQRSAIGVERYQTLYYRLPHSETTLTISIPEPTYGATMEFALRLNAIGLIYGSVIVLVLLLARQVAVGRVRFTLRFRDRIFLIVLLISLVPLVVVTNVTRTLLSERAQSEEQDRLARDATVIRDRVTRLLDQPGIADTARMQSRGLQEEVESLSQIIGREFSVFDANGRLRASSRPELYESSLFANTLSSRALEEVAFGKRSFYTQNVRMDGETFAASYQPVMTPSGARLAGVISLIAINEASQIDAEVARTATFIYGIFAALGLVLLGIGALFAARVASPIMQLINATERVAKGALKTSIPVTRDDEIGELMQSFNQMTNELEKSREIVAQTERELAWKEMARQVAHEIKNPLTPMKLSVQHLEHAFEAKDPNLNTIFRRVIRTLSEQIDVLTRIATEFSRFGAMPRRKWGPVDIRQVCESAVALFDADRNRIRFIVDVPKNLPLLHSDEDELRRAFVNLLRNAVQAIEGWGVIVIHAEESQGMLHVRMRDTGYGMSAETLSRAFDPNFSTKTSGMGLGLALVKKTITDMSGQIRVESEPGHGTTFFIDLPARGYVDDEE